MSAVAVPHGRTFRGQRTAGAMGLAAIVLLLGALFASGEPPKSSDSPAALAEHLGAKRDALLAGTYLAGLALGAFVWFFAGARSYLIARTGDEPAATAAFAAGVVAISLVAAALALLGAFAFLALEQSGDALVRWSTDVTNFLIGLSKFGFAVFLAAAVAAGSAALSRGMVALGAAAALLLLASATAFFFTDGFFQFGGPLDLASMVPATIWVALLAVAMLRAQRTSGESGGGR